MSHFAPTISIRSAPKKTVMNSAFCCCYWSLTRNTNSLEAALFPFSFPFPGLALWLPLLLLPLFWNSLFLDWKQSPKTPQTVFFCLGQPFLRVLYIWCDLLTACIRHHSLERAGRSTMMRMDSNPSVPPECKSTRGHFLQISLVHLKLTNQIKDLLLIWQNLDG